MKDKIKTKRTSKLSNSSSFLSPTFPVIPRTDQQGQHDIEGGSFTREKKKKKKEKKFWYRYIGLQGIRHLYLQCI